MKEAEAILEIRNCIYNPLGYILEKEGDRGFINHGPDIVKSLYRERPEIFSSLVSAHAESGYTRKKVVYDDGKHVARIMEWCPKCNSHIHGHGGRVCFDIVLQGELVAINFMPTKLHDNVYILEELPRETALPGECLIVNPYESKSDVHMIISPNERSKSLNFYPIDHRSVGIYVPNGDASYNRKNHILSDD